MSNVHVITHPLVQHKLTLMRKKDASTNSFRRLLGELSTLMAYEVTRDMPLQEVQIQTPLETMTGKVIDGKKLVLVSILRAGNGILEGMLNVVPGARVGHIGLYRDPKTLTAIEYYFKMPSDMHDRDIIVVDPMLATGNSAVAAVKMGTSGCAFCSVAMPSGAASRQTNLMERGRSCLMRSTAAAAELPVASMGSTTMTSRSAISDGILK